MPASPTSSPADLRPTTSHVFSIRYFQTLHSALRAFPPIEPLVRLGVGADYLDHQSQVELISDTAREKKLHPITRQGSPSLANRSVHRDLEFAKEHLL